MSQATTTSQPIPNEFVPSAGGTESTDASTMLVLAYMALWVIMLAFVALNWRRQRALSDRLSDLERNLPGRDVSDRGVAD